MSSSVVPHVSTPYQTAFAQALAETQLSQREITNLWADYQYQINGRSGRPYDHIPLVLPRKTETIRVVELGSGKTRKDKSFYQDPDEFYIETHDTPFSRGRFYRNYKFQTAVFNYYQSLDRHVEMIPTKNGAILKIY